MSAIDTSKVIDVVKTPQIVTTDTSKAEAPKALPLVTVYKSATCGCCSAWIDHMKDNGFPVEAHNSDNLNEYKVKAKLGASLGSCHTAFVDGYAIEGHVPANDIKRLLSEKPDISGLTAPGMPMNSPGMAPKGSKPSGYDVISFKDGEAVGVFTKY
ncbi:metal-binding protein [Leucothrix pacifica]|uniref:Metal-binding protein n=2 Tax=Leucothrix pacifica TaxID=1247513 RepID=A0A317C217_9GAMM|nr:metal-binding protein [Leucothrix pacifica]